MHLLSRTPILRPDRTNNTTFSDKRAPKKQYLILPIKADACIRSCHFITLLSTIKRLLKSKIKFEYHVFVAMSLCIPCQKALPDFPCPGGTGDTREGSPSKPIVFINPRLPKGHLLLHSSWESFKASLEADCPVCWTIWRNIRSSPIVSSADENIEDFRADITRATYKPIDSSYLIIITIEGQGLRVPSLLLNIWKTNVEFYKGKLKI